MPVLRSNPSNEPIELGPRRTPFARGENNLGKRRLLLFKLQQQKGWTNTRSSEYETAVDTDSPAVESRHRDNAQGSALRIVENLPNPERRKLRNPYAKPYQRFRRNESRLRLLHPCARQHETIKAIDGLAAGPSDPAQEDNAKQRIVKGPIVVPRNRDKDTSLFSLVAPDLRP